MSGGENHRESPSGPHHHTPYHCLLNFCRCGDPVEDIPLYGNLHYLKTGGKLVHGRAQALAAGDWEMMRCKRRDSR